MNNFNATVLEGTHRNSLAITADIGFPPAASPTRTQNMSLSFIWKHHPVNPNLVPAFSFGVDTGLDFDPAPMSLFPTPIRHSLDPEPVLNPCLGPGSRFCSQSHF
ncbi:hypothetical protein EVAR_86513_1 [Eumeta japonica]|uniref:Uncharacterized protein n=1 Tax=Eumeta variegata TaxID=151549 RepID=A0A4C1VPT9_EUMVA|nr:hypothetical protein EVAR_86513_1 [Eumeta japonica]